jgi:hypothetical protein
MTVALLLLLSEGLLLKIVNNIHEVDDDVRFSAIKFSLTAIELRIRLQKCFLGTICSVHCRVE